MIVRVFPVIRRLALAFFLLALIAHPLAAHGILQRSLPRANAVLPSAPGEIVLEFNEAVEPQFSQAELLGPQGASITKGGTIDGGGRRLRLPLETAGAGIYTVRWRVLSAVDGHTASGSFVFAVGAAPPLPPASTPPAPALPPSTLIAARWLTYVTALLLAGTVLFEVLVLFPVLGEMDPVQRALARDHMVTGTGTLRRASGAILLMALVFEFGAQSAEALGGGIAPILRRSVVSSLLIQTKLGWSLLLRLYATVLLLLPDRPSGRVLRAAGLIWLVVFTTVLIILGGPSALGSSHVALIVLVAAVYGLGCILAARLVPGIPDVHVPQWRTASVIAGGVLLAGFTLGSHAAGRDPLLAVSDWLHLSAAAAWVGGLPALIVVLRKRMSTDVRAEVGRLLIPRVSALAGGALLVMILTGVAASWAFVASLRGFIETPYGRGLAVKLALVAVLAALGAVNRFMLRPRIAARDAGGLNRLRRSITVEVVLGAVILLIVAALGIMPPAAVTAPPAATGGVLYAGFLAGERVLVRLTPAAAGLNDVIVESGRVRVHLRSLETSRKTPVGPDESVQITDGWWEITLANEAGQTTLPVFIGTGGPGRSDPGAVRLLAQAEAVMRRVRTWRETERITDGSGHVVETEFEAVRPNRLRYRTTSGSEAVIIGPVRFSREQSGPWTRDPLPQPLALDGPYVQYLDGATGVRFGTEDRCGEEACRVVLWSLPSAQAQFAARIGGSGRIHQIAMVAPAHYMSSRVDRLNAPVTIAPP